MKNRLIKYLGFNGLVWPWYNQPEEGKTYTELELYNLFLHPDSRDNSTWVEWEHQVNVMLKMYSKSFVDVTNESNMKDRYIKYTGASNLKLESWYQNPLNGNTYSEQELFELRYHPENRQDYNKEEWPHLIDSFLQHHPNDFILVDKPKMKDRLFTYSGGLNQLHLKRWVELPKIDSTVYREDVLYKMCYHVLERNESTRSSWSALLDGGVYKGIFVEVQKELDKMEGIDYDNLPPNNLLHGFKVKVKGSDINDALSKVQKEWSDFVGDKTKDEVEFENMISIANIRLEKVKEEKLEKERMDFIDNVALKYFKLNNDVYEIEQVVKDSYKAGKLMWEARQKMIKNNDLGKTD